MATLGEDRLDERRRLRADCRRPADEPGRRSLGVRTVRLRHVLRPRGVPAALVASRVRVDANVAEQELDRRRRHAYLEGLFAKRVRNRIVMPVDGHVVVPNRRPMPPSLPTEAWINKPSHLDVPTDQAAQ